MSNKVYGIYSGCIYEGGGVNNTLYSTKEKARIEAYKEFRNQVFDDLLAIKRAKENDDKILLEWRQGNRWKASRTEDRFYNSSDEIILQEFTLL